MELFSYSFSADRALVKFNQNYLSNFNSEDILFKYKIGLCGYQVLLVSRDSLFVERLRQGEFNQQTVISLYDAWKEIGKPNSDILTQELNWKIIDAIGEGIPKGGEIRNFPILRQFQKSQQGNQFFILLTGDDASDLSAYQVNLLCNLWQLEKGSLPIHTAGIIHKGGLYLFGGPSGAGKSTVSAMSSAIGDDILDEDQVLIHRKSNGQFIADGWGYSVKSTDIQIRGFFNLVKGSEDRLIALTGSTTTKLILAGSFQALGYMPSGDILQRAFCIAAAFSRSVPGYELHFRKSPDFWKLIDKQFSD